jgi:N-acyl-D-aspartate/D-glutamate deacylase
MKRILLTLAALAILSSRPALATGGFSCTVDDANLKFEAQSALGAGMGAPILNLEAKGEIKMQGVAADLAQLDFSKHLVHSWMAYPDTRLHFYREREANKAHGYVELVIAAVSADDTGEAKGTYDLTVFEAAGASSGEPLKATGVVSCFVE